MLFDCFYKYVLPSLCFIVLGIRRDSEKATLTTTRGIIEDIEKQMICKADV